MNKDKSYIKRKIEIDQLGMCASALCIIHCMALPVLLIFGLDSMLVWLENEAVEFLLIGLSLIIGLVALVGGYSRHKQHFILVLFIAGFLLLVNGHSVVNTWVSVGLSVSGALVIAYSHVQNLRWKKYEFTR